jgi:hypothetical protein
MVANPWIDPVFVWGMLFVFDLIVGTLIFFPIMWDTLPNRFAAPLWVLGWLYLGRKTASLLTTALTGHSTPWGLHNLGAPFDILQNAVVLALILIYLG